MIQRRENEAERSASYPLWDTLAKNIIILANMKITFDLVNDCL